MSAWDGLTVAGVVLVLLVIASRGLASPPYDFGAYDAAAEDFRAGRRPYEQALAWRAAGHVTGSPDPPPVAGIAYVYPLALVPIWKGAYRPVIVAGLVSAVLVLFSMLPGTQVIAWGFYAYRDGPIAPPLAFATFLFLAVLLAAAVLNVAALRLLRREAASAQRTTQSSA